MAPLSTRHLGGAAFTPCQTWPCLGPPALGPHPHLPPLRGPLSRGDSASPRPQAPARAHFTWPRPRSDPSPLLGPVHSQGGSWFEVPGVSEGVDGAKLSGLGVPSNALLALMEPGLGTDTGKEQDQSQGLPLSSGSRLHTWWGGGLGPCRHSGSQLSPSPSAFAVV